MFPLVPYHALPKFHAAVKTTCRRPTQVSSLPGRKSFQPVKDPAYPPLPNCSLIGVGYDASFAADFDH
jgi:fatty acid desaturase